MNGYDPFGQNRSPLPPLRDREIETNGNRENGLRNNHIANYLARGGAVGGESRRPVHSPLQYRVPTENRFLLLPENTPIRQEQYIHYPQEKYGN